MIISQIKEKAEKMDQRFDGYRRGSDFAISCANKCIEYGFTEQAEAFIEIAEFCQGKMRSLTDELISMKEILGKE